MYRCTYRAKVNALARSENRYNEEPTSGREWRFYKFNVTYLSSTGGPNDALKGSDIIYDDTFFPTKGSSVNVADKATFSDQLEVTECLI